MKILNEALFLTDVDIEKVEKKFKAKYVYETSLKQGDAWRYEPSLIFYTEEPHPQGSNWFAISKSSGDYVISNALETVMEPIVAVVAENQDVIYSRYRHDYRTSPDKSVWIDGGRDYFRGSGKAITLKVNNDKLEIQDATQNQSE